MPSPLSDPFATVTPHQTAALITRARDGRVREQLATLAGNDGLSVVRLEATGPREELHDAWASLKLRLGGWRVRVTGRAWVQGVGGDADAPRGGGHRVRFVGHSAELVGPRGRRVAFLLEGATALGTCALDPRAPEPDEASAASATPETTHPPAPGSAELEHSGVRPCDAAPEPSASSTR